MDRDKELARRVRASLVGEPGVDIDRIRVDVHDGVVTLTGDLTTLEAACLAQRRVMRVRGARAVINELSVCSDELKEQLCGGR